MFVSRDLFDEEGDGNGGGMNAAIASTRPVSSSLSTGGAESGLLRASSSSQSSNASTLSSSQSISTNISSYDTEGQALTPAMRKQKMEELRLQQLGKRKGRMLVPTVVAKNDRPTSASTSTLGAASPLSPSRPATTSTSVKPGLGGATAGNSSGYHSFNRTQSSLVDAADEKDSAADTERPLHPVEREMMAAGISPTFDPNPSRSNAAAAAPTVLASPSSPFSLTALSPLSLRLFLTSPCSPAHHHQCYITRNKKGLANRLYPLYHATYEQGERTIMTARKRAKNKTSNYVVTAEAGDDMLGKVRSNFVGTEFSIYDDGINPDKAKPGNNDAGDGGKAGGDNKEKRAELGCVLYESNILGSRGPRKMTVLIPSVKQSKDSKQVASVHRPASTADEDSLLHHYKQSANNGTADRFTALVNKTPKWNEQVGAYVLNFNGRVTMASVKNFQLMIHSPDADADAPATGNADDDSVAEERPCLQFGRVGKDMFTMDFGWPLSPLQAFAICLSSFDYKLACE